ncbi:hypothetical protein EJB05_50168, partial [Eragrostis curvula]
RNGAVSVKVVPSWSIAKHKVRLEVGLNTVQYDSDGRTSGLRRLCLLVNTKSKLEQVLGAGYDQGSSWGCPEVAIINITDFSYIIIQMNLFMYNRGIYPVLLLLITYDYRCKIETRNFQMNSNSVMTHEKGRPDAVLQLAGFQGASWDNGTTGPSLYTFKKVYTADCTFRYEASVRMTEMISGTKRDVPCEVGVSSDDH